MNCDTETQQGNVEEILVLNVITDWENLCEVDTHAETHSHTHTHTHTHTQTHIPFSHTQ